MKDLFNAEIERCLIAAIICGMEKGGLPALGRAEAVGVTPETFTVPTYRKLYEAAQADAKAGGVLDFTILCSKAGVEMTEALPIVEGAYVPSYAESYAGELIGFEMRRKLKAACVAGIRLASSEDHAPDYAASEIEASIAAIGQKQAGRRQGGTLAHLLTERLAYFTEAVQRGYGGLLTGISWFDDAFGGLNPGRVYIVSGPPAGGKTTIVRNIAVDVAKAGRRVAFATLEIPAGELAAWCVCSMSGVPMRSLDRGNDPAAVARFAEAAKELESLPMTIEGGPMTPSMFASWARRQVSKGAELLCVDYIQLLQPEAGDRGDSTEERRVSKASNAVLQVALTLNVPVLAIASESNEGRLRHSGQLSYDCAGHIRLEKRADGTGPTVSFCKVRHGPPVDNGLALYFHKGRLIEQSPEAYNVGR